tara:strand:+ start:16083 stop:16781 length:699 start_codon:yes stop_codon:yes gene_type:complete
MGIGRPITLTANIASKSISVTCETEGQTSFTVTGGYRINELAVFRNGTRLVDGQDFTARDGSTVTLVSGASVADTLEFQIFDSFNIADAINANATTQTIDGALVVTGGVTGSQIGIQSGGTAIGVARTVNFIGTGNTVIDKGDGTLDVSISGSGGGGIGTAINYTDGTATPFSYIDPEVTVGEDLMLDDTSAGTSDTYIVSVIPQINIASGIAVTVGSGKTMIVDVLQIGDL